MNKYRALREKQQEEFNNFPMMFAYNKQQFDDGVKKLGLKPNGIKQLISIGYNGYIRKSDVEKYKAMIEKHSIQMKEAMNSDTTGEGFLYDMFLYELENHEFCITGDDEDAIDACGLSYEKIAKNPAMLHALNKAKKYIYDHME